MIQVWITRWMAMPPIKRENTHDEKRGWQVAFDMSGISRRSLVRAGYTNLKFWKEVICTQMVTETMRFNEIP